MDFLSAEFGGGARVLQGDENKTRTSISSNMKQKSVETVDWIYLTDEEKDKMWYSQVHCAVDCAVHRGH